MTMAVRAGDMVRRSVKAVGFMLAVYTFFSFFLFRFVAVAFEPPHISCKGTIVGLRLAARWRLYPA